MPAIKVSGDNLGSWDVTVSPWEESVGRHQDLPHDIVWTCKHPFMVEFDDPQYIEYCTNYGPAADLQKSEVKIAPSALGSFGAPRGAKKGDYYQVEATVVEGTPAGLYKYTIRICPAGNEVIPVDPGYRVKP